MQKSFDYLIFGCGIYGLYAAGLLREKGLKVAVVDCDAGPFKRASYVNQTRVHNGYHYPRSVLTAEKTAKYYDRFKSDFSFAINNKFKQVYAIAAEDSLISPLQFRNFCKDVGIPAVETDPGIYFSKQTVEAAFVTEECSFDQLKIRDYIKRKVEGYDNVEFFFNRHISGVKTGRGVYEVVFNNGDLEIEAAAVLNATYAGTNQVLKFFGFAPLEIKYELCEVICVNVEGLLKEVGLTVMDGEFFSLMPFGSGGTHAITAVPFSPHLVSYGSLPAFNCQALHQGCTPDHLANCNSCEARPKTAWEAVQKLVRKFLFNNARFSYEASLFAVKPTLKISEIDDSRPTVISRLSHKPLFISVLSGKINTIYDLEDVL